jgi:hypothetical protein
LDALIAFYRRAFPRRLISALECGRVASGAVIGYGAMVGSVQVPFR